jgi:Co/Zn/Cd efflux system component
VLLDRQGPSGLRGAIRASVEERGDELVDLHLWTIAPGKYSLILSVVTHDPQSPADYRNTLPSDPRLAHVTIEVWPRQQ